MHTKPPPRACAVDLLRAGLLAVLFAAVSASADDYTWTGGGSETNWSTAANWSPSGPPGPVSSGTATNGLIFSGSNGLTNYNNLPFGYYSNITFLNGGFYISGANLGLSAGSLTSTNDNRIPGLVRGGAPGNRAVNNLGGQLTIGSINMQGQNVQLNGAGTTVISGALSGTAGSLLRIFSTGQTVLGGDSSAFVGSIHIYRFARLTHAKGLGGASTTVTLDRSYNDAYVDLNGLNVSNVNLTFVNAEQQGGTRLARLRNTSATPASFSGNLSTTTSNSVGVDGSGNLLLGGVISGTNGLVKQGAGVLTLSAANTYSGTTTVSAGTLITTTASTGAGSYVVSNSATLGVSIASGGQSLNMSSLALGSSTLNLTLEAANPTSSVIAVAGALTLNGTVTVNVLGGSNLSASPIVLLSYGSGGMGTLTAGTVPSIVGYTTVLTNDTTARQLKLVFSGGGTPPGSNLVHSVTNGNLVLDWPTGQGWLLQSNSVGLAISNAWFSVPGATPPWTVSVNPAIPQVFYRLRQGASPAVYTVTYNCNGNTGGAAPTDSNSPYTMGATVTVLGEGSLTKSGSTFAGWNTAANGTGTGYGPGSTFAIGANATLYAQWAPAGTSAALIIYGDALASGWTINGWSGSVNTGSTSPVHGGTASMAYTLSAGGGQGPYTGTYVNTAPYSALSFWLNGGASGGQALGMQICRAGSVVKTLTLSPLPANTWTNVVLSLSSLSISNVTDFNCFRFTSTPGASFSVDDVQLNGVTVYAVTYNGNGNTGGTAPIDGSSPYPEGSTVTVLGAGSLGKLGHAFTGWNTAANGSGTSYSPGNTFISAGNTTLYAQWSPSGASYSVAYNGNGNTGGTAPTDPNNPYTVGSTVTVLGNTGGLTNVGYAFGGWNTATNGTGTSYSPGSTFIIGTNITLYAQWNAPAFVYPYTNYNLGLLDPQLTGWPLTTAESNFVVTAEYNRRPGSEVGQYRPTYWPMTPSAGYWGSGGADTGWLNYHTRLVTNDVLTRPGALDILLVGDSITAQWNGQFGAAWNSSWQTYYSSYSAINIGIGGDKTQNVLWRLDHGGVQRLQPKVCVLQIGNNDMYFTSQTGIPAATDGIVWCVKNLRQKFPGTPVILVNVFPIVAATNNQFFLDLKATHDALNALNLPATDPMIRSLDLWNQMIQADGTGNPALFYDGTHPNATGYTLWATNMLPLVQQAVGH